MIESDILSIEHKNMITQKEGIMSNRINEETARTAFEAMADKIAGREIIEDQQKAIDEMDAFREEYKEAVKADKDN